MATIIYSRITIFINVAPTEKVNSTSEISDFPPALDLRHTDTLNELDNPVS